MSRSVGVDDDDDDDAIYNVATYSDAELLDFLDVNAHASDRELEAKGGD
jgi:hypothetical protein